jgi:NOL1/NOP2/sun family putative RNA methylase
MPNLRFMSSKQFFVDRYEKLGWSYHHVKARQAVRINESNAQGKTVLERLKNDGVTLDRIPFLENGYWVRRSRVSVGATAEYLLGLYSIQEAAAQIPALLFSDLKSKIVLDACAAPGGKTVQLANLMESTGLIVALDVNKRRLSALANHLERCHVSNSVVYDRDARYASGLKFKFDRVLLDVPCSGNFVTDQHWFKRRTLRDIERNSRLQRQILTEASKCLKDDGEIIYSTCSLEPEEDELNVDWAIRNLSLEVEKANSIGKDGVTNVFGRKLDTSISCCRRIWPGDTQGFFVCKLKKQGKNN